MNSCAVQRVVLGIFRGLMADRLVLDFSPVMAFAADTFLGGLNALANLVGADFVFVFTDFMAVDCVVEADARGMVNS